MALAVISTMASVGYWNFGSGTSSVVSKCAILNRTDWNCSRSENQANEPSMARYQGLDCWPAQ